jgi:hypothetical protein
MIARKTCIRDFLSPWDGGSDFCRPPMLESLTGPIRMEL